MPASAGNLPAQQSQQERIIGDQSSAWTGMECNGCRLTDNACLVIDKPSLKGPPAKVQQEQQKM